MKNVLQIKTAQKSCSDPRFVTFYQDAIYDEKSNPNTGLCPLRFVIYKMKKSTLW